MTSLAIVSCCKYQKLIQKNEIAKTVLPFFKSHSRLCLNKKARFFSKIPVQEEVLSNLVFSIMNQAAT